ncbi:hypothetical protein AAMO2058_000976800 [Amorphochlora amoebiformis]
MLPPLLSILLPLLLPSPLDAAGYPQPKTFRCGTRSRANFGVFPRVSRGVPRVRAEADRGDELAERMKAVAQRDIAEKEARDRDEAEYEESKTFIDKGLEKIGDAMVDKDSASDGVWGVVGGLVVSAFTVFYFVGFDLLNGIDAFRDKTPKLKFEQTVQQMDSREREELKGLLRQMEDRRLTAPEDVRALEGSAVLYTKLGNYPKAAELLNDLVKSKPEDAEAWRVKAEVEDALGQVENSLDSYEKALALKPGSIDLWEGYTRTMAQSGDFEQAIEILEQAKMLSSADVALLRAEVYTAWPGHTRDAEKMLTQLVEDYPLDPRVYVAKGAFLNKQDRKFEAAEVIKKGQEMINEQNRLAAQASN